MDEILRGSQRGGDAVDGHCRVVDVIRVADLRDACILTAETLQLTVRVNERFLIHGEMHAVTAASKTKVGDAGQVNVVARFLVQDFSRVGEVIARVIQSKRMHLHLPPALLVCKGGHIHESSRRFRRLFCHTQQQENLSFMLRNTGIKRTYHAEARQRRLHNFRGNQRISFFTNKGHRIHPTTDPQKADRSQCGPASRRPGRCTDRPCRQHASRYRR